ncbi:hypothetical protein ACCS96_02955, partial [Rhizobium ruizarguesonis]
VISITPATQAAPVSLEQTLTLMPNRVRMRAACVSSIVAIEGAIFKLSVQKIVPINVKYREALVHRNDPG